MADITDPQAVLFVNQYLRPLADLWAQAYKSVGVGLAVWDARSLATVIPAVNDKILDASGADAAKPPITGNDVRAFVAILATWAADIDANNLEKRRFIAKLAPNP